MFDTLACEHSLFSELFAPTPVSTSLVEKKFPEISLCAAILENGISELFYQNNSDPGQAAKIRRDAKIWMLSKQCDDIYSFETLCNIFDIDPDYLRQDLLYRLKNNLPIVLGS